MKRYISIFMGVALTLGFASCSKEDPFSEKEDSEMGKVLKSALALELNNEEALPALYNANTRAAVPTADDFTVDFIKDGDDTPYSTYKYSEMPEVVTLPTGAFRAVAHYGENNPAAWEEPYFAGETAFVVVADRITEDVSPIVAKLSNVRVSITFSASLKAAMSDDSKVVVKVGDTGSLEFTAADEERSAYFAYVENSNTLTATFSGAVEGYPVVESKVYDNVQPGSHYAVTFKLHDVADDEVGSLTPGITVDASVEVVDMTVTFDPEEDEVIEDDLRPVEGGAEEPEPGPGEGGDDPAPANPAPTLTPLDPTGENAGMVKTDLNKVNNTNNLYCAFHVKSVAEGGIKEFKVVIESEALNEDALAEVGLAKNLDLVNPGEFAGPLEGLGFPINVGGMPDVDLNITTFMPMLAVLGSGDHQFIITVSDANGSTVVNLRLHVD